MDERSYASEFLQFSAPIDERWLSEVSRVAKVYIIGNGVTAQEYVHILRRQACTVQRISPEEVIADPLALADGYMIVACHHQRDSVVSALEKVEFVREKHFDTFYRLLRNRAVFDFRAGFDFTEEDWSGTIAYIRKYQTLGGIDILINSKDIVGLNTTMGGLLKRLSGDFHLKLSIDVRQQFDLATLACFEVDLVELLIRDTANSDFDPAAFDSVCQTARFRNAHVVYIDAAACIAGANYSSEQQADHPPYYDAILHNNRETGQFAHEKSHSGFCLSRRMYPIFDGKLNLKLCSLFDAAARTRLSKHDAEGREYVSQRNALCSACKRAGIYRIQ